MRFHLSGSSGQIVCALCITIVAPLAASGDGGAVISHARGKVGVVEAPVSLDVMRNLVLSPHGVIEDYDTPVGSLAGGGNRTDFVVAHTNASFDGGNYTAQEGFATDETAAASFTIPASHFPIRFVQSEMVFVTDAAIEETVTEWSVRIFQGTPDSGGDEDTFSSDDVILPHIRLGPGTAGINVVFVVDPSDPDQIIISDDGTHTFSVGYRIDEHNAPSVAPCLIAPASNRNLFPTTDTSGLQVAAGNWLDGLDCGPLGCPPNGGWSSFLSLPTLCRPSGDWVIRVTYSTAFDVTGACCLPEGSCTPDLTAADCEVLDGLWQGEASTCDDPCPEFPQACCVPGDPPLCVDDLVPSICEDQSIGGTPQGVGSVCSEIDCFATGACCLPDGSCIDAVTPEECAGQGGAYQGTNVLCADASCPQPVGACCVGDSCFELREDQCVFPDSFWAGPLTTCADGDGNGTADVCEPSPCPWDVDQNGIVDPFDSNFILARFGCSVGTGDEQCDRSDLDGDGKVDPFDSNAVLANFGPCP